MSPAGAVAALPVPVSALHLGSLHPVEQALTLVLAFGPFVALGAVVLLRRRQDRVEEQRSDASRDGRQEDR